MLLVLLKTLTNNKKYQEFHLYFTIPSLFLILKVMPIIFDILFFKSESSFETKKNILCFTFLCFKFFSFIKFSNFTILESEISQHYEMPKYVNTVHAILQKKSRKNSAKYVTSKLVPDPFVYKELSKTSIGKCEFLKLSMQIFSDPFL